MFVALRDLRFARGRFILIGSVAALITVLVGFLSGLTGGLATQNISAVLALPGDRIVFAEPSGDAQPTFADSVISSRTVDEWSATPGVDKVAPIGVSQTRAEAGDARTAVAVLGVQAGIDGAQVGGDGSVVVSKTVAEALDVSAGDALTIAGTSYTVKSVVADLWYSHTPVVQMTLHDWQALSAVTGNPGAYATVMAVTGNPDWAAADAATATVSTTPLQSLTALASFRSEIGSLLLMVALLFGISGLVIGAFFTVWTMQRKSDIAVLKALGASTASLIRDALGQALMVLVIGIGVGLALVAVLGGLAGSALPFLLSPLTTIVPGAIMIALGLAGAAFALRSVTSADPLTALGSNR
ncbi:putative ABC transport system permease protein [Microbacterium sp. AG1240]|uniref:ABC transporter permease n=1 Tax=Microbacterium sp. AG1240 TaxID=2183992 RepID=UPI000EB0CBC6|nr:ABC transporter permease [Microbacterium sp. AG1240]RKT36925.1 putative ABC transport system permease protein [Microbacterium sp. AG1240]